MRAGETKLIANYLFIAKSKKKQIFLHHHDTENSKRFYSPGETESPTPHDDAGA
jgi:hypothetical protein